MSRLEESDSEGWSIEPQSRSKDLVLSFEPLQLPQTIIWKGGEDGGGCGCSYTGDLIGSYGFWIMAHGQPEAHEVLGGADWYSIGKFDSTEDAKDACIAKMRERAGLK